MLTVAFRVDASSSMGEGHVRRCLTAATGLSQPSRIVFVHKELTSTTGKMLKERRYGQVWLQGPIADQRADAEATVVSLAQERMAVDRMVVDHYGLSDEWHSKVMQAVGSLIVIDDLADRKCGGNALIDPTFGRVREDYAGKLSTQTECYLGVDYVCLRRQFAQARASANRTAGPGRRVHLLFGGVDVEGYTSEWARILMSLDEACEVYAAAGNSRGRYGGLKTLQAEFPGRFHYQVNVEDMASHMGRCNLAVGSPGTALWERACLGIPTFCLATSANQCAVLRSLDEKGFCMFGGHAHEIDSTDVVTKLRRFLGDERLRSRIRKQCSVVDGKGASRVAEVIRRGH